MADETSQSIPPGRGVKWVGGLAVLLGVALRLYDLGRKVLHSDEGVNGWFALRLFRTGEYCYNPKDYHGPFLYFADQISFFLIGLNDFALRLPGALAGALMPLAILVLAPEMGAGAAVAASLLFALDPIQTYFARTVIHEVYLVAFTLLLVVGGARFVARGGIWPLLVMSLGLLGMFANKETAVMTVAALVGAVLVAVAVPSLPGQANLKERLGQGGRLIRSHLNGILGASALFVGLMVAFFSSFGGCWEGVPGIIKTYSYWFGYGVSGRNQDAGKDWLYFGRLLWWSWPAVVAALPGAVLAFWRRDRFGVFLTAWSVLIIGVYSFIPYKTPWCVLSLSLPVCLLGGWFIGQALDQVGKKRPRWVPILAVALALPLASLGWTTWEVNFQRYDDGEIPFIYVQTDREFRGMADLLLGIDAAGEHQGRLRVLAIGPGAKNPLRWYLYTQGWQWNRVRFEKTRPPPEKIRGDIVLCERPDLSAVRKALGDGYEVRTFPLRRGHQLSAVIRAPLLEAWAEKEMGLPDDAGPK